MQIPDRAMISQATLLLEGHAFTWWMMLTREHRTLTNWQQFEYNITNQFQSFNASLRARDQLYSLKQIGSVTDYIGKYNTLIYQIDDLSESETFYQFKKGLKPAVLIKMDEINIPFQEGLNSLQILQDAAQR
jgi:Retrotransposon gag protein